MGDVILGYSEDAQEVAVYHVTAVYAQEHATTLDVTISGETLHTTAEHPFFVMGRGWVNAGDLVVGDVVRNGQGETGLVEAVLIVAAPQVMYNLSVSHVATYLVGEGRWVVHNEDFMFVYRFASTSDALPALSRERFLRRLFMGTLLQFIPGYEQHIADLHSYKARHPFSPFVSLTLDVQAALNTEDAGLASIMTGYPDPDMRAPYIYTYDVPASHLITPRTGAAMIEKEVVFRGRDLRDFWVDQRDNPYHPDDATWPLCRP